MKKIAIHCPTEELWDKVQKKAFSEGCEWYSGTNTIRNYWHSNDKCLVIGGNVITHSDIEGCTGKGYTIIPAEEWLKDANQSYCVAKTRELDTPELKVGTRVEVVKKGKDFGIAGNITAIVGTLKPYCVKFECLNEEVWFRAEDINPIPPEPNHSVPLRVGDKVRVVRSCGSKGKEAEIIEENYVRWDYLVSFSKGYNLPYNGEDLELIPTEADITVGSVWEDVRGGRETVTGFDKVGDPITDSVFKNYFKSTLLEEHKLIHRGDEVGVRGEGTMSGWVQIDEVMTKEQMESFYNKGTGKQTNKKEKKMKRAEKVIALGNLVEDTDCDNQGKVVALYPTTKQVSYEESDGTVRTVHVSKLISRFVMPKVKVVKAKKKKGKK